MLKKLNVYSSKKSLGGVYKVPGSKNSSLALLCVALMTRQEVILNNIPDIEDIRVILDVYKSIGVQYSMNNGQLKVNASGINTSVIPAEMVSKIRPTYYFVGAMLNRFKDVEVGYPGGDKIGARPIDQHEKVFEAFGARIDKHSHSFEVQADELIGTKVFFDMKTCGATIDAIMIAANAQGRTELYNAAQDPEVVDVCIMLSKMGAHIKGGGTEKIIIDGVEELNGCVHEVIPDRIIAGTFLIMAGLSPKPIRIDNVVPEHMQSVLHKLTEMNVETQVHEDYIIAHARGELLPTKLVTGMYPEFPSDLQQPMTILLTQANGASSIKETIYPKRFQHCEELIKMGADININPNGSAEVYGPCSLSGCDVTANDIRAGVTMIIAGVIAQGITTIHRPEQITRGYPMVKQMFAQLGCKLEYVYEETQLNSIAK